MARAKSSLPVPDSPWISTGISRCANLCAIACDRMIISDGYNGTPSGFENCCEDEEGLTNWYVLHAEANAILKVASSTQTCQDATLYITLSPCKDCSKLIHQSGIKRVVFQTGYRDTSGIDFLKKAGVEVVQIADLSI